MVASLTKLTDDERDLFDKYFANYEFAIAVNRAMRGQTSDTERCKAGMKMAKAIKEKGFASIGTEIFWRSMDCEYIRRERLVAARSPVGKTVECLITAADNAQCTKFGSSRYIYAITMPAGERYVRNSRENKGVAPWFEYLMPPGMIWYYGAYEHVPNNAIPVVYSAKVENELSPQVFEACLRPAGIKDFPKTLPPATANLGDDRIVPLANSQLGRQDIRYVRASWGALVSNNEGRISVLDVRRSDPAGQSIMRRLSQATPSASTMVNGIPLNEYEVLGDHPLKEYKVEGDDLVPLTFAERRAASDFQAEIAAVINNTNPRQKR
jgi:hypothetical protein